LLNLYLFFNNHFYENDHPVIRAESKAFRYGELVFETIRFQNGVPLFLNEHFNRLKKAASLLQIQFPKHFSSTVLQKAIEELLQKSGLLTARVRITLFKGNGGLFEDQPNVFNLLIESYRLQQPFYELNSNGLDICFFDFVKKTKDIYSNYKTGNHLIYNLAAQFTKKNKCNEAVIFNTDGNVCDASISNIFIVKQDEVFTPPLSDGCIDGIFRNYLLNSHPEIIEQSLTEDDLFNADEIFLTNTVRGMQWVKNLDGKQFHNTHTVRIFNAYVMPLNEQLRF
jgi:branched-chain amino acid aminotransferase